MDTLSLATQTMFAELLQRCLDAEFDETYQERGNFRRRRKGNRFYWYFQWDAQGRKHERYARPRARTSAAAVTRSTRVFLGSSASWVEDNSAGRSSKDKTRVIRSCGNVAEERGSRTHQGPARGPSRI